MLVSTQNVEAAVDVAGMTSNDCQQVISPSVSAENRAHFAEKISEPPELKCCAAACMRETCV